MKKAPFAAMIFLACGHDRVVPPPPPVASATIKPVDPDCKNWRRLLGWLADQTRQGDEASLARVSHVFVHEASPDWLDAFDGLASAAKATDANARTLAITRAERLVATCPREKEVPGKAGRLEPFAIQSIMRGWFVSFKTCYFDALRANPSLAGSTVTKFVIGADGHVVSAVDETDPVLADTLHDQITRECVAKKIGEIVFPPPSGGIVTVDYPLTFSPGRH